MHQSIETPTPPQATVGDSGGMEALLSKIVAQGGGLLTTIEPPPRHVRANVGKLTCKRFYKKILN